MLPVALMPFVTCYVLKAQNPISVGSKNSNWRSAWNFDLVFNKQSTGNAVNSVLVLISNCSDRKLVGSNLMLQFQGNGDFLGSARIQGHSVREYEITPHGHLEISIKFDSLEFFDGQNRKTSRTDFFKAPETDCQVRVWMGDMWSPKPLEESNLFVLSEWRYISQKPQ